jgi:F0F1-type ATP synthase assembly protein I
MTGFNKSDANMVRTAWELSAAMLSFVVALALGWWFGRVLDAWLGTAPWSTWLFTGLGFEAGVLNVYRTLNKTLAEVRRPKPPDRA